MTATADDGDGDAEGCAEGGVDADAVSFARRVWGEVCEDVDCTDYVTHPTPEWMIATVMEVNADIVTLAEAERIIEAFNEDESN